MIDFDHIGIATINLELAIGEYVSRYGASVLDRENLIEHGVEIAFLNVGGATVELLSPLNEKSPLNRFIAKYGPGMHHLCFRVPDLRGTLEKCRQDGMTLIDEAPRLGARGHYVAFVHPKSCGGVLTEYCQH